ncbi:uncharacterized protein LOC135955432 [Calliphora vicina]|uniref:uncharacterized protein LOC135955432 n=1 Tax=Calliphora vicina TaxID=7373 RepID=UPI00325B065B
MSVEQIEESFNKRKSIKLKQRLLVMQEEVQHPDIDKYDEVALSVKVELLDKLYSDFEVVHDRLERENYEEMESTLPAEVSAIYTTIKTTLTRKIMTLRSNPNNQNPPLLRQSTINESLPSFLLPVQKTRLPIIQIPTFNGIYTDWPDFFSMFETVIGNDDDLSKIEKFQHLKTCLGGSALDSIRSLEISATNYDKAIEILKSRFDNKRLNFQAHIRDIVAMSNVEVGSVGKLRHLSDSVNSHLRALLTMGTKEQIADCLLIHIIGRKLDITTQTKWEETTPVNEIPTWELMAKFLQARCQTMENVENSVVNESSNKQVGSKLYHYTNKSKKSLVVSTNSQKVCPICNSPSHAIYSCPQFLSKTPSMRYKDVKRLNLCINCLKKGHAIKTCVSSGCRHCSLKHNSLLHMDTLPNSQENHLSSITVSDNSNGNVSLNSNLASSTSAPTNNITSTNSLPQSSLIVSNCTPKKGHDPTTILATAIVFVKNGVGSLIPCRAILDSASQANFITTNFVNKLQLKTKRSTTLVSGIGQSNFASGKIVSIFIQSRTSNVSAYLSSVVVSAIVDNQPPFSINISKWNIPTNIQLADPLFFKSQQVDLLIGGDLFFESLCNGKIHIGAGLPLLQKTEFGWVVAGGGMQLKRRNSCLMGVIINENNTYENNLDNFIRRFWEIENHMDVVSKITKEEKECENYFVKTYNRLSSGEFVVRLPFKTSPQALGESYKNALCRFKNLEKRLNQYAELKSQYSSFINEYIELQHMSLVEKFPENILTHFLPHHCVTKADSSTTKLRVVFDGSAKTSTGVSLNDILMCGPNIQPNLFDILLRFRSFNIALTGDICKMYRCVKVLYPDNFLQCILWRNHVDDPIKVYKLDTVTYGTKSASFLAVRAMRQLAKDECHFFPLGSKIVLRDFYVDDMISGGDSMEEVNQILEETTQLLKKGNFKIRKWCSNDPRILSKIKDEEKEKFLKFKDGTDVTKTLGLIWEPNSDIFLFSFVPSVSSNKITKRTVLSTIARCYDPLGLIGPAIVQTKIFLQHLWKEKIDRDDSLPQRLQSAWINLCSEFNDIEECKFPRRVITPGGQIQIHAFCDASLSAYGVCVYIRSEYNGVVNSNILCSKSRVAPTQVLTIPKLELSAALLLSELMYSISNLHIFNGNIFCWSDSTIVLSWIQEESSNYQVFVSNRISRIQSLTSNMKWFYVPTTMNPADILSRGATPKELSKSNLWSCGPEFLKQDQEFWPSQPSAVTNLPERRKQVLILTSATFLDISLNCKYITSFGKISRVYAYIYKFGAVNVSCRRGPLTTEDIHKGTKLLIRMVQRCNFTVECECLCQGKPIPSSSSLISLNPFMDNFGLLRVGGRLKNSALDFNAQHPIIIPRQHPLTDSIITYFHEKNLHAGPQSLLATIRLQYWPLGGRKVVTRIVNKCVRCLHFRHRVIEHIMGNLPHDRVQAHRAFLVTGVDYCGPLYYRAEIRSRAKIKCYISLFICFSTKAVHLELVKDLSTQGFLAALKRFISIRGRPKTIWSDNATNFVGSRNELQELKQLFLSQQHLNAVHEECLENLIDWKFIPPRSPHFGGLWEASIKVAKFHLLRSIGQSVLEFDELRTIICQISAIMNSRPLCPLSENPDDLGVLTPAHFLIGAPITSVVEPDVSMLNIHRLSRWQRVCFMQQLFWKRWSTEYLTILQQRTKWQVSLDNITIGTMVLLKDENLPPLKWQMGRVLDVIKGDDCVVRVAVIKTANGIIRRAVSKICILLNDDIESSKNSMGAGCLSK